MVKGVCANCGHDRSFHRESGGLSFCFAVKSRVPEVLCDCKRYVSGNENVQV